MKRRGRGMVMRREKIDDQRFSPEVQAQAVEIIRRGGSNVELMALLKLGSYGALKCVWAAFGWPKRTRAQVQALQKTRAERSGARKDRQDPPAPFLLRAAPVGSGPPCIACEARTAPNGLCLNCGVSNTRRRVA